MTKEPEIIQDIWNAILDDRWMWIAVWGGQRLGKTTVQLQCSYSVYKDWDQVLESVVFNLAGILYKMDQGRPCRIMTRNRLHNRVPILLLDDFGAASNKAKTQHDPTWDIFKGAFDTFATKIAVLMASMVVPTEPTFQLYEKFTHEVWVYSRGCAKYDVSGWQQNYKGWQGRQKKEWIDTFDFEQVPTDVYKQYDEMRMSLVDELEQQIKDTMADTLTVSTIKRLAPSDIELMEVIQQKGMISRPFLAETMGGKYHDALIRCKARSLIVPVRKQTAYWYDLTDFGLQVLDTLQTVSPEKQAQQKAIQIAQETPCKT